MSVKSKIQDVTSTSSYVNPSVPQNRRERRYAAKQKLEEGERPDLSALRGVLPPFVLRTHPNIKQFTGLNGRSFANLDCLGQGPEKRIMLGNTVAYERESLIRWLENRSRIIS